MNCCFQFQAALAALEAVEAQRLAAVEEQHKKELSSLEERLQGLQQAAAGAHSQAAEVSSRGVVC